MDGYAVRAADVANTPAQLKVVGESAAGAGWHQEMNAGEAVRIMTGAPVPVGADAVQQVELTREPNGTGTVEILESVEAGRSIVKQAAEIKSGETVLRAGDDINAQTIATLASFGYAQVIVGRRPRVAVMATGSELVDVNEKPGSDQIRDSNNYTIEAYARLTGATVRRLPLAGDDREELRQQMSAAVENCDVLITSAECQWVFTTLRKPRSGTWAQKFSLNVSRCDRETYRVWSHWQDFDLRIARQSRFRGGDFQSFCARGLARHARCDGNVSAATHRGTRERCEGLTGSRKLFTRNSAHG
jgi:hypothetical protein